MARILHFGTKDQGLEDKPKMNPRERANAKEWLEEMGFVIDDEETPQTNSQPNKREPAA